MKAPHQEVVRRPSRFTLLGAAVLALTAVGIGATIQPAAAAEPSSQVGASVTVTAVKPSLPAEVAYLNALHRQLDQAKRYPTGREASLMSPAGTTAVWVEVDRDGRVIGRGIEASSYSSLLDQTALALVGRTTYKALPNEAWSGETTHRFRVAYQFRHDTRGTEEPVAVAVQ